MVDILIVDKAPSISDFKNKKPCSTGSRLAVRNILFRLKEKYKFSAAITNMIKKPVETDKENIKKYEKILKKEFEKFNPKVVVFLGKEVMSYYHNYEKNEILIEENCIRDLEIYGKNYKTISTMHPSFCVTTEFNIIGTVYTAIEKAILFTKGVDLRINNDFKTVYLDTIPKIKKALKKLSIKKDYVAVDTETYNLNRVYGNDIISIQLANSGSKGYLIPFQHFDSPFTSDELLRIKKLFKKFFTTRKTKILGYIYHNAKYDLHQLFRELKIILFNAPFIDTSYNEYLLEENYGRLKYPKNKGPYTLFTSAYRYGFNYFYESGEKEKRANLRNIPIKEWIKYGAADVVAPYQMFKKQLYFAKIRKYSKFKEMAITFGNALFTSLTYIEHCGMPINKNTLRSLTDPSKSPFHRLMKEVKSKLNECESVKKINKRKLKSRAGVSNTLFGQNNLFDISGRLDQETLFYDVLKLESTDKNKKKTTDKKFLKTYKGIEEVDLVAKFRRLQDMQTGQINNVYKLLNKTTGNPDYYTDHRVRANYFPLTVTGRLSCKNPNLQQRVSRGDKADEVLSMYESKFNNCICKFDHKTFEVRGLGFESKDEALCSSFIRMDNTYDKYREDPYSFLTIDNKRRTKNLKDILFKKIKSRDRWKSSTLKSVINKLLKDYNIINTNVEESVKEAVEEENVNLKKAFISYLNFIIDKNPVWRTKTLLQEILNAVKLEARRILALANVKNITDPHKSNASLLYSTNIQNVNSEQRQDAKSLIFGITYGMSINSIAEVLKISVKEAKKLFKLFANNMPDAFNWLEDMPKLAKKQLYLDSGLGRRRHLWGYLFDIKAINSKMDRLAKNNLIQGECSDLNEIGTYLLIKKLSREKLLKYQKKAFIAITNLVHDSGESELPINLVRKFVNLVEPSYTTELIQYVKKMFNFDINIRLGLDFEFGLDYSNTKKWDGTEHNLQFIEEWLTRENLKRLFPA